MTALARLTTIWDGCIKPARPARKNSRNTTLETFWVLAWAESFHSCTTNVVCFHSQCFRLQHRFLWLGLVPAVIKAILNLQSNTFQRTPQAYQAADETALSGRNEMQARTFALLHRIFRTLADGRGPRRPQQSDARSLESVPASISVALKAPSKKACSTVSTAPLSALLPWTCTAGARPSSSFWHAPCPPRHKPTLATRTNGDGTPLLCDRRHK